MVKSPIFHEEESMTNFSGVSGQQLRQYIERIERLEEEKANLSNDIREVFGEAKSNGFDTKIMRQVIKIRKMNHEERAEQEEVLSIYLHALGMAVDHSEETNSLPQSLINAA
jgi:uncharacterized protein (UPF0335 family)